jgi:hypothetical protein
MANEIGSYEMGGGSIKPFTILSPFQKPVDGGVRDF